MTYLPEWARIGRAGWKYRGQERPPFALPTAEGEESVWDYPRPPRLEPSPKRVEVKAGATSIAVSDRALRLLETASPPTYYLPLDDVSLDLLEPSPGGSACEWKGLCSYWSVRAGNTWVHQAAWSYPDPLPGYEGLQQYLSFYPGRVECFVDGERVQPQPGEFYGGWVTSRIVGPVKGEPGTGHW